MKLQQQYAVLEAVDFRLHFLEKRLADLKSPRYRLEESSGAEIDYLEKRIKLLKEFLVRPI